MSDAQELVTVYIDGAEVRVPKGTNLIEAAKAVGTEIPHYCYHPHLSVAGNCRMCQVQVEGQPKMTIACNTCVSDNMSVRTQKSSPEVANAQRATLEFLLINHPLDCTVCDQAGHCKLQDYYYEYNSKASRFTEEKQHKVKAEPVGPEVIYDGERCIVCTRCVRFCDEVTGTSEFGVFNRGDNSVIGIHPGRELDNPFSGCVVDLCPVGALTHRRWRFNTRIWYTSREDTICTGCSTGCNVNVCTRDGQIVQVKARQNDDVNKEWMCDEGRYGFQRFQPQERVAAPFLIGQAGAESASWDKALAETKKLVGGSDVEAEAAVFISPFCTMEEVWLASEYAEKVMGLKSRNENVAMQLRTRELSELEKILISPDYAPNARAAEVFGLIGRSGDWRQKLDANYQRLLNHVRQGGVKRILIIGDGAILDSDVDDALRDGLRAAEISVALVSNAHVAETAAGACKVVLPGRTVHEKNGVMVSGELRVQRLKSLLQAPIGTLPEWMILKRMGETASKALLPQSISDERSLFREMVARNESLAGLSMMIIGDQGISLDDLGSGSRPGGNSAESAGAVA